jgi:hypothetical protein
MRTLFCGVPCTVVVLVVYRNGGVDWLRSLGAVWFPGLFGWFIWRDEDVQPFARWLALATAVPQVMGVVAALVLAAVGPATLQRLAVKADLEDPPAEPTKAPPPATEEDLQTLGLRPPCAISSIPPGARVLVDGKERGVTPLETRLAAGAKNRVRLELAGYFSEERVLEPNANERSALELELRRGGRVVVTSTPPGARVSLTIAPPEGDPMVLAKTPGPTATLEPGPTEQIGRAHV